MFKVYIVIIIFSQKDTQCLTGCGPHNRAANTGVHANTGRHVVFTCLKPYFIIRALIFYACEGLNQHTANQLNMKKNYGINIFSYARSLIHMEKSDWNVKCQIKFFYQNILLYNNRLTLHPNLGLTVVTILVVRNFF
jgi:hypothetical protein